MQGSLRFFAQRQTFFNKCAQASLFGVKYAGYALREEVQSCTARTFTKQFSGISSYMVVSVWTSARKERVRVGMEKRRISSPKRVLITMLPSMLLSPPTWVAATSSGWHAKTAMAHLLPQGLCTVCSSRSRCVCAH
eukprot:TRINITY_DN1890_c0_g1_i1.p1 TRINITY_DN1890_c0_g1~~TRINITY_DN1890_c0_g1_i1.p1  ORF type:complete len:136 (-),score=14.12 TRINITY_DN1890_c0_g1_i1:30-437(-)